MVTIKLKKIEMRLKTVKSPDFQMEILVFVDTSDLAMSIVELLKVILSPKAHKN